MNIDDHNTFIDQLLETAKPAGCNDHQINLILMLASTTVESKPIAIAVLAAGSGCIGL
jgi:hypothetical protein